jgi:predicted nucleic acid-binding protein
MSHPGYSPGARFTPGDLISRLRTFATQTDHEFWPDDVSLRDGKLFAAERIHSSRQLTDLYLIALASKHAGKLATFDQAVSISALRGAKAENLCVI